MGRLILGSVLGLVLLAPSVSMACGMYNIRPPKMAKKSELKPIALAQVMDTLDALEEAEVPKPEADSLSEKVMDSAPKADVKKPNS